jgi:hypothetical protein
MNDLLPLAKQNLSKYETLIPFAGVIDCDGKNQIRTPYDPEMDTVALLRLLEAGLCESAAKGEITATVVFLDGYATLPGSDTKTDALICRLDQQDGYSVEVVFPYQRSDRNEVVLDEPITTEGGHRVFPQKPVPKFW